MNVKEMINALRSSGHSVGVYNRPDGGQRITSIDGVKYKGSAGGNNAARQILGVKLSGAQRSQRIRAGMASVYGHKLSVNVQLGDSATLKPGRHKAARITPKERAFLKKYNKAAKALNINLYERKGAGVGSGKTQRVTIEVPRITAKYFRKGKTRFGASEEIRKLKNNLRKGLGFALAQHVEGAIEKLKSYVKDYGSDRGSYAFPLTIAFLEANRNTIDDQTMIAVLQMAYDRKNYLTGNEGQDAAIDRNLDKSMRDALSSATKKLKISAKALKKLLK